MKKILKSILTSILVFSILITGCTSKEKKLAIDSFKNAVHKLEKLNSELDKNISEAELLVTKKEAALDEKAMGNLETAISKAKAERVKIPEEPKDLSAIKSETENLQKIDYSVIIKEIIDKKTDYEKSVKQLKQVTAPTESFIIERIKSIEGITGISAVTEDNDPNKKLNKQGGYTSQVYFTYNLVNQNNVIGDSIIEKGTLGGGSIEVYKTVEDAKKRNDYLSSFDSDGLLKVGSHTVLGTIVIRTSDELTASQQKELENKITESFIK